MTRLQRIWMRPGRLVETLLILVTLGVVLFPIYWMMQMSLKWRLEQFALPPKYLFAPSLANYRELLDGDFLAAFWNSTVVALWTTAISLLAGVPAAYGLSRLHARALSARIQFLVLAVRMAPAIVFALPFFLIFRYLNLIDTKLGLVIVYLTFNLPLVIWMLGPYFDAVPREIEEASVVDGARPGQTFLLVLPLVMPGLVAAGINAFLFAWNEFFFALVLTRSRATTGPIAIVNFLNYESGFEWGKITAGGTLVMLPMILFAITVRKYLVRGIAAGAVKG